MRCEGQNPLRYALRRAKFSALCVAKGKILRYALRRVKFCVMMAMPKVG